jgi:DNA-binding NarL/FixJ family response regulator
MRRNEAMPKNRTECAAARARESEDGDGKLTRAEKRILALVSAAQTNKEIAFALGISPATVKRHLENVLRKLALKNRVEAAIYGLVANGCPNGSSSACPLALWRKAKHDAGSKWAV